MTAALPRSTRSILWQIAALGIGGFLGPAVAQDAPNKPADLALGQHVYMEARCFACHGQNGFGGAGPRFREDRFLGLTDYVVGEILLGRDIMPAFATILNDDQVAAVASYIRNSWGNNFGPVRAPQVAAIRNDVKEHPPQGGPDPSSGSLPTPENTLPSK